MDTIWNLWEIPIIRLVPSRKVRDNGPRRAINTAFQRRVQIKSGEKKKKVYLPRMPSR